MTEILKGPVSRSNIQIQCLPDAMHIPIASQGAATMPSLQAEVAIDANPEDGYQNVIRAVQDLVETLTKSSMEGKFPLNVLVEMRLLGYSDTYLAPAQAGMTT